ncbi:formylglycine-generating enzyme family protein [Alkalitalea saponilacus]|uniref:Formylglycine-generating enzyme, required for sulfatase activity, contains SUMF1/FGE domain n=1 Tax=Alkalitalea saponilacus TaxID=889453 RepID=A0A1T5A9N6_9BACT|nr:SUMF1/EgtB/PvdO family nonheme iron enzyme [Alkalitalea saponilacus]ASB48783.1 transcriptional regulator [Alkalitalea saponilacus]SKB31569.1 Formylglycine-generating enzyme, required for sulfatase activity, contains SUMF1/FGE domain [Alkalitalea saponilacus]
MKKFFFYLALMPVLILSGCKKDASNELILINGGEFKNEHSYFFGKDIVVKDFFLSKYEITQKEWIEVMGYNPSQFSGDNLPVDMVSWYECILYCNRRSEVEGFTPYYIVDTLKIDLNNFSEFDDLKWSVKINEAADGYRLPTEIEWDYAASGGIKSNNYIYSGSNNLKDVAWYWRNSGNIYLDGKWSWVNIENNHSRTRPVGQKRPNELGLYDMSGNVREWCWDWYEDDELESGHRRVWRGGGWIGGEHACAISYRGMFEANGSGPDQGFRVARNAP